MAESHEHYSASDRENTRHYSWAAAMGGGYVMVLGMDVATTPVDILEDHGRMVEFFEQTNFNTMAPSSASAFSKATIRSRHLLNPATSIYSYIFVVMELAIVAIKQITVWL